MGGGTTDQATSGWLGGSFLMSKPVQFAVVTMGWHENRAVVFALWVLCFMFYGVDDNQD